jgi:hypothetical protein
MNFRLNIQPVPGDGDCLFYSVSHILNNRFSSAERKSAIPKISELAKYLRSKVAMRVMDARDEESNAIISTWHKLWSDALREKDTELMMEMRHMQNVMQPMSTIDRKILFRNMLNPGIYWGDEFALKTMEKALGCIFVVVNDRFEIVQREYTKSGVSPSTAKWISMLLLRGMHYEPLHDNSGTYCWTMGQLPDVIQNFVNQLFRDA